jgi:thymidine phosphorylase
VDLLKKLGDKVVKGEPVFRVHAEHPADFKFSKKLAVANYGYTIGAEAEVLKPLVSF